MSVSLESKVYMWLPEGEESAITWPELIELIPNVSLDELKNTIGGLVKSSEVGLIVHKDGLRRYYRVGSERAQRRRSIKALSHPQFELSFNEKPDK